MDIRYCGCGCGNIVEGFNSAGRLRKCIRGHSNSSTNIEFDKNIINRYINSNISLQQLSKETSCSRDIIVRILKNNDIPIRTNIRNMKQYANDMVEMYNECQSMNKIAEKYKIAVTHVRTILKSKGVDTKLGYNNRKGENNSRWKERDEIFLTRKKLRNFIYLSIKKTKFRKNRQSSLILGCSWNEFKLYIESKWEDWMNWENYGNPKDRVFELNKTWDLDHIIPISSAKSIEEVYKLNHYTNIQPLCSVKNRWIKRENINI